MPEIHFIGFGPAELFNLKNAVRRSLLDAAEKYKGSEIWDAIRRETVLTYHQTSTSEDLDGKTAPYLVIESANLGESGAVVSRLVVDLDPCPPMRVGAPSPKFVEGSASEAARP